MCTEGLKPHRHAALIKAWADGAIIQFKNFHGVWTDTDGNRPEWTADEYRIKPAPLKTVGYRRYVYRLGGEVGVGLQQNTGPTHVSTVERSRSFVRWIDTEWQYETVEVE